MSRSTHNQRIARRLKSLTGLAYQTCLNNVIAAAEAGLLPSPLDEAGIEKAAAMLASGITSGAPLVPVPSTDPFEDILALPHGLVLVAGPVGTGKSTLLYEAAQRRSERGDKVITVEQPIERRLDQASPDGKGLIVQSEWGTHLDRTFRSAFRHALKMDPDTLITGEIRDIEQASAAINAALTGHLVFVAIHANSVASTIDRMIRLHQPDEQAEARFLLAESLEAVVVMRREGEEFSREVTLVDDEMRAFIRTDGRRIAFPIGEDTDGRQVSWRSSWDNYPALSVVGPTGYGKSVLAASLARSARDQDVEVYVIDTVKDGADYRDGHNVIRTDKGAVRLIANLNTAGPMERLLIVEEPDGLRSDASAALRRLVAQARSLRLRVVLVSQQDSMLGKVIGSTVDFSPGGTRARGWAQFHDRSKGRHIDVRVWGPTVDEIAEESRTRSAQEAPKAVAVDLRRLSTLLRAGLMVAPALAAVAKSSRNDLAREAFAQMAQVVGDGEATLSGALRVHPHLFDEWVAAAVEAGETAGIVTQILDDVTETLAAEAA